MQPPSLCADAATPTCPFPPALQSNNALPTVPPTQLSAPAPHAGPPTRCCRRPRERIHRPQTRRRRENNIDSLDKLRMSRENVLKALDIFECLVKRERKKRDLVVSRELAWCGVREGAAACVCGGLLKRERKKRDLLVVSLWEGWDCTYSGWADETACVLQT